MIFALVVGYYVWFNCPEDPQMMCIKTPGGSEMLPVSGWVKQGSHKIEKPSKPTR